MSGISDKSYQQHDLFKKLEYYVGFYEAFSMSIMLYPTIGTTALINIDTYIFSSIKETLESVIYLLIKGSINDAFALLRIYMMSSNYIDALDCDVTPEPDSQYWVNPQVQRIFDELIRKQRPDLYEVMKENTSMQLS